MKSVHLGAQQAMVLLGDRLKVVADRVLPLGDFLRNGVAVGAAPAGTAALHHAVAAGAAEQRGAVARACLAVDGDVGAPLATQGRGTTTGGDRGFMTGE